MLRVVSANEFYPYGQGPQSTTQNHYLFSGKERDLESGLDYFGARYYAAIVGRFMSPDWSAQAEPVPYAKLEEPQSLNLYAYVRNNPISLLDPDGHYPNDGWAQKTIYRPDAEAYGGMMGYEMMKSIAALADTQQPKPKPRVDTVEVFSGPLPCGPSDAACGENIKTNYIFFYYALRNIGSWVGRTSGPINGQNNAPNSGNTKAQFRNCVSRKLEPELKADLKDWGRRLTWAPVFGAGAAAAVTAVGVFTEPELLPVAHEIFGLLDVNLTATAAEGITDWAALHAGAQILIAGGSCAARTF